MDRGGTAPSGRVRMEGALLRAAAGAGAPVPGVIALGEGDELGASWLVVDRLEGELDRLRGVEEAAVAITILERA